MNLLADDAAPIPIHDRRASTTITPVLRAQLLDRTVTFIRQYVVVTPAQADTIALWIAHSHAIEAAECTPYLAVLSEEPRSGKTRLLEVTELLVRKPLRTSDITEAALFRMLSQHRGITLLLDEIDTVFGHGKSREGLRALLNASYRRGSLVRRVVGGYVEEYEVFGPKMIAGIGDLPDTVADRSITIHMARKERGAHVERFNARDVEESGETLQREIASRFQPSEDTLPFMRAVSDHRPDLPDYLNDRQQDGWEPLLAIADVIGEDWPTRARDAARELSAPKDKDWREEING